MRCEVSGVRFGLWALGIGLWALGFGAFWWGWAVMGSLESFLRRNVVFLSQMATCGLFFGGFRMQAENPSIPPDLWGCATGLRMSL